MHPLLASAIAFLLWLAIWAGSAFVLGALSVVLSVLLERWLQVGGFWTGVLRVAFLGVCPGIAFAGSWLAATLFLSPSLHGAVRQGELVAGVAFAAVGLIVVATSSRPRERGGEYAVLFVSLVVDALGCLALLGYFPRMIRYMLGLGGG